MDKDTPNVHRPRKARLVFFLKLTFSLGIMIGIFSWIPLAGVWESMRTARPWPLVGALMLWFAKHLLAAYRTALLTWHQGLSLRTMDLFRISAVTSFYKKALPGGMGGSVIRWYKMSRPDGKPIEAFNVILYDRTINALVLILFGGLFLLLDYPFDTHPMVWPSVAALGIALAVNVGIYLIAFNGRLAGWVTGHVAKFLPARIRASFYRLASCADHFHALDHRLRIKIWLLAVLGRLLNLLMYYLLVVALSLPVGFVTIAWVRTVVYLIVMIPVTISGLGLREGAMLLLLAPYGIEPEHIVALSMLVFILILIHAVLGGLYELSNALTKLRLGNPRSNAP